MSLFIFPRRLDFPLFLGAACPTCLTTGTPLYARRTGKGDKQQELKERLGCLHQKLGDPRWGPSNVRLVPLDTSKISSPVSALSEQVLLTAFSSHLSA